VFVLAISSVYAVVCFDGFACIIESDVGAEGREIQKAQRKEARKVKEGRA
jgi:hypothetical protein